MTKTFFKALIIFASLNAFAQESNNVEYELEVKTPAQGVEKEEIVDFIDHHLKDSHDFNILSWKGENGHEEHFGFPLPVILYSQEDGLVVFSSSKLHHGESVAHVGDNYYMLDHGHIYKTDAEGTISYDAEHHATNDKPFDLSITKNIFMIFLVSILMLWMFSSMAKSYKKGPLPSGFGRFLEPIILYIRDDIAIPNIGEKNYKRYMPYLLTVFFFIWILNLFGLTPLGTNVTGNIAVTMALALITYLITNLTANRNYWGHIFWMPGVPKLMRVVLAPIELLGTIIKPFALMIRLYANMVAGHTVLMSIIGLMFIFQSVVGSSLSFVLAFALSLLELLVAALQAYIFTMLSALYFGSANEEHHDDQ